LSLSAESVSYSTIFFSHNKSTNNTFCHRLSGKQKGHDEHPFAVDEHKLGNSGEPVKAGKERRTLGQKSGLGTFPGLTGRTVTRDDRCQVKGPALRNDAGSRRAGRMQDLPVGIGEQRLFLFFTNQSRFALRDGFSVCLSGS
jgi:hypothetical protein